MQIYLEKDRVSHARFAFESCGSIKLKQHRNLITGPMNDLRLTRNLKRYLTRKVQSWRHNRVFERRGSVLASQLSER